MTSLYSIAEKNNIEIDDFPMDKVKAFSLKGTIIINPELVKTERERKECMVHELGHNIKNAFYNISSTLETRERQEERATRWAVHTLIPAEELKKALKKGYTEIWQLAEYFDVSGEFIVDAIRVHKTENNI